jgi:GNAT superfamily N-acetyltransferase
MTAPRTMTATTADGAPLRLRPLTAADQPALEAAFHRLSEQSRYRRFFAGTVRLTPSMLHYLLDVDDEHRVAIVAFDPWRPSEVGTDEGLGIGVARYVRDVEDPAVADVAVTVVDDYQRRGVASSLLTVLGRHAWERGIRHFRADVLAENQPVLDIVRRRGGSIAPHPEGANLVEVLVPVPAPADALPG